MIAWWWILVVAFFTNALTLLVFGIAKSGSDFDDQHEAWMAGVGYAREHPEFMAGGVNQ